MPPFQLDPRVVAKQVADRMQAENDTTLYLTSSQLGRLTVIVEDEVRKAFVQHLEQEQKDKEQAEKLQAATKKGFGSLGDKGPGG